MSTQTKNVLIWVLTFTIMVIICLPGLWIILSAFRTNGEILTTPAVWIPEKLTLDNFKAIFGWKTKCFYGRLFYYCQSFFYFLFLGFPFIDIFRGFPGLAGEYKKNQSKRKNQSNIHV